MQTSVTVNKFIEKYDKSNMYRYLKYFYEQISTVEEIFTEVVSMRYANLP